MTNGKQEKQNSSSTTQTGINAEMLLCKVEVEVEINQTFQI